MKDCLTFVDDEIDDPCLSVDNVTVAFCFFQFGMARWILKPIVLARINLTLDCLNLLSQVHSQVAEELAIELPAPVVAVAFRSGSVDV